MITSASSMSEVLNGLTTGEDDASYEFVRRQAADSLPALAAGAQALGNAAFDLQLKQPDTLMAWKYPAILDSVELAILQPLLTHASEGASVTVLRSELDGLAFGQLITLSSLSARLRHYSERALSRGPLRATPPPDPQMGLLPQELPNE